VPCCVAITASSPHHPAQSSEASLQRCDQGPTPPAVLAVKVLALWVYFSCWCHGVDLVYVSVYLHHARFVEWRTKEDMMGGLWRIHKIYTTTQSLKRLKGPDKISNHCNTYSSLVTPLHTSPHEVLIETSLRPTAYRAKPHKVHTPCPLTNTQDTPTPPYHNTPRTPLPQLAPPPPRSHRCCLHPRRPRSWR
jgi:hypothetical protein